MLWSSPDDETLGEVTKLLYDPKLVGRVRHFRYTVESIEPYLDGGVVRCQNCNCVVEADKGRMGWPDGNVLEQPEFYCNVCIKEELPQFVIHMSAIERKRAKALKPH